jgi:hypothetical protein
MGMTLKATGKTLEVTEELLRATRLENLKYQGVLDTRSFFEFVERQHGSGHNGSRKDKWIHISQTNTKFHDEAIKYCNKKSSQSTFDAIGDKAVEVFQVLCHGK